MFLSQLFTKTSKESSSDAGSVNADLLTRAGFITRVMAGVYAYLPLGLLVLRNIEQIVREEMDKIGNELFMPSLAPQSLWEKTGRKESMNALFAAGGANAASRGVNDGTYILNATHEEIITPIVQQFCQSYQDLPCAAYQIQTKFRNEARPKSGILRGREFRMKDMYSFHASEEDMLSFFLKKAIPSYTTVFGRLGLGDRTVIALASGGDFSKEYSREFQTKCETGEDHIFHVPGTDTFYNREIAPCLASPWDNAQEKEKPLEHVEGKGVIGVEELAGFLRIEVERTTKTLLFQCEGKRVIAAAVRGDYDVNEEKLKRVAGSKTLALASAETIRALTGAETGYAGPLGLPSSVEMFWDDSTKGRKNFECGANRSNEHTINVNFGRDIPEPEAFVDIKIAKEGDLAPDTKEPYEVFRASEVGNVFTLYRKFTDSFGFTYKDRDGKDKPVYMGCYGMGTTRVMGVLAEVFHDEKGFLWPAAVSPARAHIVPLAKTEKDDAYVQALDLLKKLEKKGVSCLFDDRLGRSVGERLADADLIGIPLRILFSPKSLEAGGAEVKERATGKTSIVSNAEVVKMFTLDR